MVGRYITLEAMLSVLNNAMLIKKANQTFMYYLFKDLRETCQNRNGAVVRRVLTFTFFEYWYNFSNCACFRKDAFGKTEIDKNLKVGSQDG